ncbi:outermembrane adhesin-like protein [Haloferula helveola]|uniref:Outermembrane adhesin-like protein n=1 Tax=Haloferula helveola TaxID=490095 RepID=A0ABN6H612_9BACT|nr:outermembrane adhesin-like protein [Haloferula helveola]
MTSPSRRNLPGSCPTLSTLASLGLLAVSATAQTTLFSADFESSTAPSIGTADYNVSGTTAVASLASLSSSPDPTLGTSCLALDRNQTGLLDARLDLSGPASLAGADTVTLSFDVAAIRTNGEEKSTIITGYDLTNQPVFALVLGDANCFGNAAADRQRPGYEVAGPTRQPLPGTGSPAAYWWGNGGTGTVLDVTKDAHFDVTIGGSSWTVASTDQSGTAFTSDPIASYDGASHSELAYLSITTYTGNNFGLYWDNIEVVGIPASVTPDTYVWTAAASGGDAVSLFGENNWSKDGDNVTLIPQIDPGVPVNHDLVVNAGTPGGGGAGGSLDLGIGSLTVSGGVTQFALGGDNRILNGPLTMNGGTVNTEGLGQVTATLNDGTLGLDATSQALDNSTVDFPTGSTATLAFFSLDPETVIATELGSVTVEGNPAVQSSNVAVVPDGAGGSTVTPFTGDPDGDNDNMDDAWETVNFGDTSRDGTLDLDDDGLTDLAEFSAGTDPNNRDTDGDLLLDGQETTTDPNNDDSDGDGCPDGFEVAKGLDPNNPASKVDRPNILYIFCDDLGYGDLGVLFQNAKGGMKHKTPFLDTMAAEGLILDRHYCPAPVCAPSRGSLLTGMHQGHANVRDNQFDKALEDNHNLASVLRAAGYRTELVGKYGLQGGGGSPAAWPAYPTKRGFDGFFGYVRHADGHTHYPDHVTDSRGVKELYDGDLEISSQLDKCFTPDLFTAKAKQLIIDEVGDGDNEPFFIYLAYDTPHAALQIPTVAYPGWNPADDFDDSGFGVGGGVLWQGTPGSMINTATGTIDSYRHPDYTTAVGNAWTDVEERFATLVRRMDDCVGDLRKTLEDLGIENETLIVFSADNGPHTEDYLTNAQTYDGSSYQPTSFQSYGPFEGVKRDCWEGGIRQPTLVCWPGTIAGGSVNEMPAQLHDWLATLSSVAGWTPPARTDGVDLTPTLTGSGTQKTPTTYIEYTNSGSTPNYGDFPNHGGTTRTQSQVIFLDDYKGIRNNPGDANTNFEIYDTRLSEDPDESVDLFVSPPPGMATYFTELQQRMKDRVLQIRQPDGSAARPYMDSTPVPPAPPLAAAPGVEWKSYSGLWPWIPEFADETEVTSGTGTFPDLADLPAGPLENGLLYSGYISIPTTGTWTFTMTSDSGSFLRIHDIMVVDDDFNHDGSAATGSVLLEAGLHPYRIYYKNGSGAAPQLDIDWTGPGVPTEALPSSALFIAGTPDPEPVGVDDSASAPVDTPILIDVLANDIDDGLPSPLTIQSVTQPSGGTATIQSGSILYTPNAGFAGLDTFSYTLTDGQFTDTAEVTVTLSFPIDDLWLPFNEGSGVAVYDAGGSFAGALTGSGPGDPWVLGNSGTALDLDGVDDSIPISPSIYTPPLGTTPRTVTAWIKVPDAATTPGLGSIVSWGSNGGVNGNKWHFRLEDASPGTGALRVEVKGGYLRGSTDLRDDEWHHVAVVFPSGGSNVTDCILYVDGVAETPGASSSQAMNTALAGGLVVGMDDQNRHFQGLLDEVRIYDRALSAGEIATQFSVDNQTGAAWHARYFGDAAIDWNTDDDGDTLTRLLEFGLVGNPHIASLAPLPVLTLEGGIAKLAFDKPLDGFHNLVYTIEDSLNLTTWNPFAATIDSSSPGPFPQTESVIFNAGDGTLDRRFLHLKIELAP